jgi:adenylate cyclase
MNIFDSYTERVRGAIAKERLNKLDDRLFSKSIVDMSVNSVQKKRLTMQPEHSLLKLTQVIQGKEPIDAKVGMHPDFVHLKGSELKEWHYITSVFIDIKGSTKLNDSYDLDTIFTITNTIQSAAIHVCLLFGGHIQRLQGDGVFAYFGGKGVDKTDAVRKSVTATSMFTYFVKNDLQKIFEEEGVENISTRIGVDFGDDHEVMWGEFGVGGCSELTTCSLHTSLAPKMQSYAGKNGIVVGQNVKDRLKIEEEFFDYVRDSKGEISERYIYKGPKKGVYYTQYKFDWFNYLKSLPFISSDKDGNLYVTSESERHQQQQLANLRETASLISSGSAFTDTLGNITGNRMGVKNQDHRFHHD